MSVCQRIQISIFTPIAIALMQIMLHRYFENNIDIDTVHQTFSFQNEFANVFLCAMKCNTIAFTEWLIQFENLWKLEIIFGNV